MVGTCHESSVSNCCVLYHSIAEVHADQLRDEMLSAAGICPEAGGMPTGRGQRPNQPNGGSDEQLDS